MYKLLYLTNYFSYLSYRERKKRVSGFATLRRRLLLRRRRTSKSCDHGRALRDLLSTWTPQEAQALLDEYEALAALKDLAVQVRYSFLYFISSK